MGRRKEEKEPSGLYKYPLPALKLRADLETHDHVKALVPRTGRKAKIRTLLPEEN